MAAEKGAGIAAIVLAAGFSSRMGAFKPLLSLSEGKTVLERIIAMFRNAGVDDVRVVIGHRAAELQPRVKEWGARPVINVVYHDGMFSSVVAGVGSLEPDVSAFFILPVDIPLVREYTITTLLREYPATGSPIIYPCFCGKRGHPPLISARHRDGILAWHGEGGLKSCLSRYEDQAALVETADEGILADMDTPDDYRRLLARWQRRKVPTVREGEALVKNVLQCDDCLLSHGRAVAGLARLLAEKLNGAGCRLDVELVAVAALLHDLARGRRNHAAEGAILLGKMGFPAVADIIAGHMDITLSDKPAISEKEIVYLADKMIMGDRRVSLEERFSSRMDFLEDDGDALRALEYRLHNARKIRKMMENVLGRPLKEILAELPFPRPAVNL